MSELVQKKDMIDWDEKQGKLPSMLNVLTILTFIWCPIMLYFGIKTYLNAQQTFESMPDVLDKIKNGPSFLKSMIGPDPMEQARRMMESKLQILILQLVEIGLCIYGAIMMRKFSKAGFWIYVLGEVLPIISVSLFVGLGLYSGMALTWIFFFPILFIVLYATQLKHLK